jgi:hypothetical protein
MLTEMPRYAGGMRPGARTKPRWFGSSLHAPGSLLRSKPNMPMHESKHQVRIAMLGLALASMMAGPSEAKAQPPAAGPDEAACEGKRSGEACTLINGASGACGPGTCSRLDYSQGSPPKATEEACIVCVAGAVSNEGPPALGETTETSEASSAGAEPSSGGEAKASESEKDEPPQTSSRCSVTDRSEPNDLGWLSLLLLPLAAGRRRRRSR